MDFVDRPAHFRDTMTKRRKRTARKLVLPLIAVGMMTLMMYIDSTNHSSGFGKNASYASASVALTR